VKLAFAALFALLLVLYLTFAGRGEESRRAADAAAQR
jgi:hypothetical protein